MLRSLARALLPISLRHRLRVMLAPLPPYAEVIQWTDGMLALLEQRILRLESTIARQAVEMEELRRRLDERRDHGG